MSRALLTGITLAITLSVACRGKTDDADGDGVNAADDCDDNNANNYPGNAESCDGIDNDCDGIADNGVTITV